MTNFLQEADVHFHIGVDGVLGNVFEKSFCKPKELTRDGHFTFVGDDYFAANIQAALQMGEAFDTSMLFDARDPEPQKLFFSRPLLLFAARPLNHPDNAKGSLYKLNSIQSSFANQTVFFHLFLTDHVTYLGGHIKRKYFSSLIDDWEKFSWLPLVEEVRSRLVGKNELVLWDAEKPQQLTRNFVSSTLGPSYLSRIQQDSSSANSSSAANEAEATLEAAGVDLTVLDFSYERDVQELFSSAVDV